MKSKILKILIVLLSVSINIWLAFASKIDHFKVTVDPDKAGVWEAIDLTIEAVDKSDNIVKDYEWTVLIFSESDREAEFPNQLEDNSYTFKKSDEWIVKFENSVKFKNKWTNDIHVYDLDDQTDSLMWTAEIEITDKVVVKKVDISILSPETWLTIWKKSVVVSWKTAKNHQVKIVLNWKKEILTTSDENWVFEKEVVWLLDWKNVIKASVLDWDDKELWVSKDINLTINSNLPIFDKLILTPNWDTELESETTIKAEVYASKWLDKVSIILDDWMNDLKEVSEWVYKWEFLAPKIAGKYSVDILLKDELWHKAKELSKANITIKEVTESAPAIPDPVVEPVKPDPVAEPANPEPVVEQKVKDVCYEWDFSWDLYDKKCWTKPETPKEKDKCIQWDYSWNVYDWKCWTKPVDYTAPIDLGIKNLRIVKLKTKTILTWDYLPDAEKYEVYKKIDWSEPELIQSVKDPKFEFNMSWDKIKFENFAVKAIWKQEFTNENGQKIKKEIVWDLSQAVSIQTWTKEIVLIFLALLLWFIVIVFTRKKA